MVVDAGSGGVGVLDQIMYDEAYTKALMSDGIDLLGGYGSRDNLAALEMAPMPATASALRSSMAAWRPIPQATFPPGTMQVRASRKTRARCICHAADVPAM